jgi:uncharacterized protein (DUF4213/DUF364 family)
MNILDDLLYSLSVDAPVRSVSIGARWTVVCSRHCGMSATLMSDESQGHIPIHDVDRLLRKSARELAEQALSTDLLEASVGVAAINSLLEVDESLAAEINASQVLTSLGRGKNVALVGRFHFVPQMRQSARQLWVIEQHPAGDEYPAESAVGLLPKADVIAITGSALVNHTLDDLLALRNPNAAVIVLGPSAPLSAILFDHGIDVIAGTRVVDEMAVLRTVERSASLRQVEGVKLLTLRREKS